MTNKPVDRLAKYEAHGAYHWHEMDVSSRRYNPALAARYQVLADQVPNGKRVLDLGCGDGVLLSLLRNRSKELIGIDANLTGLTLAVERLRNTTCRVVAADIEILPVATDGFDVVTMADVVEHLDRPEKCLAEVGRVLRSDGRLVLTTPKWRPDRWWDDCHVKEYTPKELEDLLAPWFHDVTLRFFWPMRWSRRRATRLGFHGVRVWARWLGNPFLRTGDQASRFGQILAVCDSPRS